MLKADLRTPLNHVLVAINDLDQAKAREVLWLALDAVDPMPRAALIEGNEGEAVGADFGALPDVSPAPRVATPRMPEPDDPREAKVLRAVDGLGLCATRDIVGQTGLPHHQVKAVLVKVCASGALERVGKGPSTKYRRPRRS